MLFNWLLMLLLMPAAPAHPIHLALTEIAYVEKSRSLQIIHKLFVDDLELHIETQEKARGHEVKLRLNTQQEHPESDTYIRKYLLEHFKLKVNGKSVTGNYIGKEYENGAMWIYVEVENQARPKQIEITDNFLIDLHEDQNNLVNLEILDHKGSFRFHKGYIQDRAEF